MTWVESANTFGFAARRNDGCLSRQETYFIDFGAVERRVDAYTKRDHPYRMVSFAFVWMGTGYTLLLRCPKSLILAIARGISYMIV